MRHLSYILFSLFLPVGPATVFAAHIIALPRPSNHHLRAELDRFVRSSAPLVSNPDPLGHLNLRGAADLEIVFARVLSYLADDNLRRTARDKIDAILSEPVGHDDKPVSRSTLAHLQRDGARLLREYRDDEFLSRRLAERLTAFHLWTAETLWYVLPLVHHLEDQSVNEMMVFNLTKLPTKPRGMLHRRLRGSKSPRQFVLLILAEADFMDLDDYREFLTVAAVEFAKSVATAHWADDVRSAEQDEIFESVLYKFGERLRRGDPGLTQIVTDLREEFLTDGHPHPTLRARFLELLTDRAFAWCVRDDWLSLALKKKNARPDLKLIASSKGCGAALGDSPSEDSPAR